MGTCSSGFVLCCQDQGDHRKRRGASEKPQCRGENRDVVGQYLETMQINWASLLGSAKANFGLLPCWFLLDPVPKTKLKHFQENPERKTRACSWNAFRLRQGDGWRDVWIPNCEGIILGQMCSSAILSSEAARARPQRESICRPFPLLPPRTCVTSSFLSPPAWQSLSVFCDCQPTATECVSLQSSVMAGFDSKEMQFGLNYGTKIQEWLNTVLGVPVNPSL